MEVTGHHNRLGLIETKKDPTLRCETLQERDELRLLLVTHIDDEPHGTSVSGETVSLEAILEVEAHELAQPK